MFMFLLPETSVIISKSDIDNPRITSTAKCDTNYLLRYRVDHKDVPIFRGVCTSECLTDGNLDANVHKCENNLL